jgi:ABC-2 type transport system permease protein
MVAQLLRLKVDLLAGEIRGGVARSVLAVVGAIAGIVVAVFVAAQLMHLRNDGAAVASAIAVPAGALIALGCTIVPLLVGASDQFDPRRFATFGLSRRQVALGVGVAGSVGVPAVGLVIVAVGSVGTWTRSPGLTALAILGAVIALLTSLLLIRVSATVGGWLLGSNRPRDSAWLVILVVLVLLIALVTLLTRVGPTGARGPLAAVAGWTPWGAAWAVPADAATGDTGRAVLELVEALVVLAVLALAWWALVGRLLESAGRAPSPRQYRNLGWFGRLGSSPVAAVAARSLTYWGRDPRYRMSYLVLVFVPVVVLPLGVAGLPWHITALVPLPLMALIAGFLPHNDVSYDNTAVWLHVASGASGWSDRLGRVVPVAVVGIPAIVVGSVITARLYGDWDVLPLLLGASASALFSGLGLSSVVSALLPYPTVRPGDHPFQQPQAAGVLAITAQATMVIGTLVFSFPVFWLAIRVLLSNDFAGRWTVFAVGVAVGVVVLVVGILIGGRVFDRHGPDILAAAQRN